jgi:hypothetical protein
MNLKAQIDSNSVIIVDFNSSLTPIYRSSRKKTIKKETSELMEALG